MRSGWPSQELSSSIRSAFHSLGLLSPALSDATPLCLTTTDGTRSHFFIWYHYAVVFSTNTFTTTEKPSWDKHGQSLCVLLPSANCISHDVKLEILDRKRSRFLGGSSGRNSGANQFVCVSKMSGEVTTPNRQRERERSGLEPVQSFPSNTVQRLHDHVFRCGHASTEHRQSGGCLPPTPCLFIATILQETSPDPNKIWCSPLPLRLKPLSWCGRLAGDLL